VELKNRYESRGVDILKRISEVFNGNFKHFEQMMLYEQKFATFFAEMQDLSQNV